MARASGEFFSRWCPCVFRMYSYDFPTFLNVFQRFSGLSTRKLAFSEVWISLLEHLWDFQLKIICFHSNSSIFNCENAIWLKTSLSWQSSYQGFQLWGLSLELWPSNTAIQKTPGTFFLHVHMFSCVCPTFPHLFLHAPYHYPTIILPLSYHYPTNILPLSCAIELWHSSATYGNIVL